MRNGNQYTYLEYKRQIALTTRIIKTAKRDGFQKLCSSFSRTTPMATVWKQVKGFQRGTTREQCEPAGEFDIEQYADYLCPANTPLPTEINMSLENTTLDSKYHTPFSPEELQLSLQQVRDSTPGKDDISYSMLTNLPPKAQGILLERLNYIWATGDFPNAWKETILKPIPKPGKPKNDIKSYRPIAIISCVAKIFERMVKNRLEHFLEKNKKIPHCITGFRKGLSTMDNLTQLVSDIQLTYSSQISMVAAVYDLQSAFDKVHIPTLSIKLQRLGFPLSVCKLIHAYLINRTIIVKGPNGFSNPRVTSR
jgi:hypothetical protein